MRGAFSGATASRPAWSRAPTAARCSSTRSAICRWPPQAGCSACSRSARSCRSARDDAAPVDVRVVAATHRDLDAAGRRGQFRHDLFRAPRGFRVSCPRCTIAAPTSGCSSPRCTRAAAQRRHPSSVRSTVRARTAPHACPLTSASSRAAALLSPAGAGRTPGEHSSAARAAEPRPRSDRACRPHRRPVAIQSKCASSCSTSWRAHRATSARWLARCGAPACRCTAGSTLAESTPNTSAPSSLGRGEREVSGLVAHGAFTPLAPVRRGEAGRSSPPQTGQGEYRGKNRESRERSRLKSALSQSRAALLGYSGAMLRAGWRRWAWQGALFAFMAIGGISCRNQVAATGDAVPDAAVPGCIGTGRLNGSRSGDTCPNSMPELAAMDFGLSSPLDAGSLQRCPDLNPENPRRLLVEATVKTFPLPTRSDSRPSSARLVRRAASPAGSF